MERVIVVSSNGHPSMPPKLWEEYLERKFPIRFLALDRSELGKIAEKIGPDIEGITAPGAADEVTPALIEHLSLRCGLFKPGEGDERLATVDELLCEDLARL